MAPLRQRDVAQDHLVSPRRDAQSQEGRIVGIARNACHRARMAGRCRPKDGMRGGADDLVDAEPVHDRVH
eukprot:11461968-Heterocapsa_arctica.AAC.1